MQSIREILLEKLLEHAAARQWEQQNLLKRKQPQTEKQDEKSGDQRKQA